MDGIVIKTVHHDHIAGYVADQHIAHSTVSINAGGILSGGGDITANRVISLAQTDVDHDQITNTHNLTSDIDHGLISGLDDDDHTQYWVDTSVSSRAANYTTTGTINVGNEIITLTQSENQINGDFSQSISTGWTASGFTIVSGEADFTKAPNTNKNGSLTSKFTPVAGRWYDITYKINSHSGIGSTTFTFGGNTIFHSTGDTGTFSKLCYTFNTDKLKFDVVGTIFPVAYHITIDDVSAFDVSSNGIDMTSGVAGIDITDGVITGNALAISTTQLLFDTSITGDIIPSLDVTYDLGNTGFGFAEGHIRTVFINNIVDNDASTVAIALDATGINFTVDSIIKARFGQSNFRFNVNRDSHNFNIFSDTGSQTLFAADVVNDEIVIQGDTYWIGDGTGVPYGGISVQDSTIPTVITSSGKVNKVQIAVFDTDGLSNLSTPDHTNAHITIVKAGVYRVSVSMSVESVAGDGDKLGFSCYKNNGATEFPNLHFHRDFTAGAAKTGSASMGGLIDVEVGDTIEVWGWNEDDADNFLVEDITLAISMVGGT